VGIFIKQLLAGRDFAHGDHFASQMANFVYLIGDDQKRVCMAVDPAWMFKASLMLRNMPICS
jgi:hypothetical protein